MAEVPGFLLPHRVDVDTYAGSGAYGDTYATVVPQVRCKVEGKRRLVRAADGSQVISENTVYARLTYTATLSPGSLVHLPDGTVSTVIVCAVLDDGNLGGWQHIQVACT